MLSTLPQILNSSPLPAAEGAAARVDREAHTGFAALMQQQADLRSAMLRHIDQRALAPRDAVRPATPTAAPRATTAAAPAAPKAAETAPRPVQDDPSTASPSRIGSSAPQRPPTTAAASAAPSDSADRAAPAAVRAAADPAGREAAAGKNGDSGTAQAARHRLAARGQAASAPTPTTALPDATVDARWTGLADLGTDTLARDPLLAQDAAATTAAPDPTQVPDWLQGQALVTGWRPTTGLPVAAPPQDAATSTTTTATAATTLATATAAAIALQPTVPDPMAPDAMGHGPQGSAASGPLTHRPLGLREAVDEGPGLAPPRAMGPARSGAATEPSTARPEGLHEPVEGTPLPVVAAVSAALTRENTPAWPTRPQGLRAVAADARTQALATDPPSTGRAATSAVMAARAGSTAGLPAVARGAAAPQPPHRGDPAVAQAAELRKASKVDAASATAPDLPTANAMTGDPATLAAAPALPASPALPGAVEAAAGKGAVTPGEGQAIAATRGSTDAGLPVGPNARAAGQGDSPAVPPTEARRHTADEASRRATAPDPLALATAAASSAAAVAPVAAAAAAAGQAAGLRLGLQTEGRAAQRAAADSDGAPLRASRLPPTVERGVAPTMDGPTGRSQALFDQRSVAETVTPPAGTDLPRGADEGTRPPLPGSTPTAAAPALAAAAAARAAQAEPLAAAATSDTVRAIEPGAPSMATPLLASGSAPAAPTLAHLAANATPVATDASIPVPLDSPAFAPALGAQISLFARDGVQTARLQLNPAEMGPITVQIALDGNAARVDFQADLASTRDVIEASLPALAGALQEAGMTLAGGGVSQQPSSHQPPPQAERSGAQRRPGDRSAAAGDASMAAPVATRSRGLVDLVA